MQLIQRANDEIQAAAVKAYEASLAGLAGEQRGGARSACRVRRASMSTARGACPRLARPPPAAAAAQAQALLPGSAPQIDARVLGAAKMGIFQVGGRSI